MKNNTLYKRKKYRKKSVGKNKILITQFIFINIILLGFVFFLLFRNKTNVVNEVTGRLHTKGTRIIDKNNNEIILKSINYNELMPNGYKYVRPDVSKLPIICSRWIEPPTSLDARQVKEMGFNSVRLVINWSQLETDKPVKNNKGEIIHKWDKNYLKALDKTISDLTENSVAVILDMHKYLWSSAFRLINSDEGFGCSGSGFPEWLYPNITNSYTHQNARCDFFQNSTKIFSGYFIQDAFTDVWRMLAGRYLQNELVIGADIINEPWPAKNICSSEDLRLNSFYQKIGSAIRGVNPYLLLIFEDSQDQVSKNYTLNEPLKISNSVYSFHLYTYEWDKSGKEMTDNYIKRAESWNVPLFLGEFDGFGYSGNDQPVILNDKRLTDLSKMMSYLKKKKVSWSFWSYSGYQSILQPNSYKPKDELMKILKKGI